eukprot:8219312-Pyramimonas_sp.AAC.1
MTRQPQKQRSLFPGQLCALLQTAAKRRAHVVAPQNNHRPVERACACTEASRSRRESPKSCRQTALEILR